MSSLRKRPEMYKKLIRFTFGCHVKCVK